MPLLASLSLCLALAQGSDSTLDVFIVDDQGSLLSEGWRFRVNSRPSQLGSRTSAEVDPETGRARFFELEGFVYVQGSHRSGEETPWERVRLEEGGPTARELALGGSSPARSLFVVVTTASGSALPDELIARNAAGEWVATLTPVRDGKFAARGAPRGVYRIETVDPRFEPLVLAEHQTGDPAR